MRRDMVFAAEPENAERSAVVPVMTLNLLFAANEARMADYLSTTQCTL
jgi:hypothetical protein